MAAVHAGGIPAFMSDEDDDDANSEQKYDSEEFLEYEDEQLADEAEFAELGRELVCSICLAWAIISAHAWMT